MREGERQSCLLLSRAPHCCTQHGSKFLQQRPGGTLRSKINSFPCASSGTPDSPVFRVPFGGIPLQLPSLLVILALD